MHEFPVLYKWVHKHHHQQTYPDRAALDTFNTGCIESQARRLRPPSSVLRTPYSVLRTPHSVQLAVAARPDLTLTWPSPEPHPSPDPHPDPGPHPDLPLPLPLPLLLPPQIGLYLQLAVLASWGELGLANLPAGIWFFTTAGYLSVLEHDSCERALPFDLWRADDHHMHHAYFKCNYSPYSVVWDKVCRVRAGFTLTLTLTQTLPC